MKYENYYIIPGNEGKINFRPKKLLSYSLINSFYKFKIKRVVVY